MSNADPASNNSTTHHQSTNNQTKSTHPACDETELVTAQWAGPLPPPSVLTGFNHAVENGAERVFRMAEKEQEHRIAFKLAELEGARKDFYRGQILGGVLALACVAASLYSVVIDAHPAVSIALVGIPITALIGKMLKR